MKKVLLLSLVLCVALSCLLTSCGPKTQEGEKNITVKITADGNTTTHQINTDALYLREALIEYFGEKLSFNSFDMVEVIDGIKADPGKGEWWMYDVDGTQAVKGVDTQPIADGNVIDFYITVFNP